MLDLSLFGDVKYVIDSDGKKAAVQIDAKAWDALMNYLENLEDRDLIKDKLDRLRKGPSQSGAIPWQDVNSEW